MDTVSDQSSTFDGLNNQDDDGGIQSKAIDASTFGIQRSLSQASFDVAKHIVAKSDTLGLLMLELIGASELPRIKGLARGLYLNLS